MCVRVCAYKQTGAEREKYLKIERENVRLAQIQLQVWLKEVACPGGCFFL